MAVYLKDILSMYIKILKPALAGSTEERFMSNLFKFKISIQIILNVLYYWKKKYSLHFQIMKTFCFNLQHCLREQQISRKKKYSEIKFTISVKLMKCFSNNNILPKARHTLDTEITSDIYLRLSSHYFHWSKPTPAEHMKGDIKSLT